MTMTDTTTTTTTTVLEATGADAIRVLDAIRAADVARSTDRARPMLTHVLLDITPDDGVRIVSTDSYRLVLASIPNLPADPVQQVIPCELVAMLSRVKIPASVRKSAYPAAGLTITTDGRDLTAAVTVDGSTTSATASANVGEYPRYRQLVPVEHVHEAAAFNPTYLADIGKVAKAGAYEPTTPVRCVSMQDGKPAVWTITDHRLEVTYLLMGIR